MPTAFEDLTLSGLVEIADSLADWIFATGMLIAVVVAIIGAFVFLTAGGDAGRMSAGKKIFVWGGIGLIVMLVARGVFTVLRKVIGA